jgi:hypothetical protein
MLPADEKIVLVLEGIRDDSRQFVEFGPSFDDPARPSHRNRGVQPSSTQAPNEVS